MDIMVVVSVINYLIYIISDYIYIYMSMYVESHIKVFYIYIYIIYICNHTLYMISNI